MKKFYFFLCLILVTNFHIILAQNLTYEITDYQRVANSSVRIGNYLFYENEGSVYRVDISNPKTPSQSTKVTSIEGIDLDYFGNYLYSFSYGQNITLNLYNVSNPLNVSKVGSYTLTDGGFFKLQEFQNKLFILNDPDNTKIPKLFVLDISNPANIVKIAEKEIGSSGSDNAIDFQVTPYNNRAYILTGIYFYIYDISNLSNITLLNKFRPPFYPSLCLSLEVVGNDLFVAGWSNKKILRYNVTDPTNPTLINGSITLTNNIYEMYYDGSHLVVINGNKLNYYSIATPSIVNTKEKRNNNIQNSEILYEYGQVTFLDNAYKVMIKDEGNIFIQEGGDYYPEYKSNSGGKIKYVKITKQEDKVTLTTQVQPTEAASAGCKVTPEGITQHKKNTVVTVIATAGNGWKFKEYTGDLTGTEAQQNITMTGDKGVTGHFEKIVIEPILTLAATNSKDGRCASDVYSTKQYLIFSGSLSADETDDWSITQLAFYVTGNSVYFDKLKLKLGDQQYFIDYKENNLNKFNVSYLLKAGEQVGWLLYLIPNEKTFFGCELPEIITHSASTIVSDVIATPLNYSPGKKLPQEVLNSGDKFLYCVSTPNTYFANIVEAINQSPQGTTISLCEGNFYPKGTEIDKDLNFIGLGNGTILTDVEDKILLFIKKGNVSFENLKFRGKKNELNGKLMDIYGLSIYNYDDVPPTVKIKNVTFENLAKGILTSSNLDITNSTFLNNDLSIDIFGAYSVNVSNSTFKNSKKGIFCERSAYNSLELNENYFENVIRPIHLDIKFNSGFDRNTIIKKNKIINNLSQMQIEQSDPVHYGIFISDLKGAEIEENKISFTGFIKSNFQYYGIYLASRTRNCYITKNEISGAFSGIKLDGTFDFNYGHHISQNQVYQNTRGISLTESKNNTIVGNNISYNVGGIYLNNSKDNNILANEFSWNLKNIVQGLIKPSGKQDNTIQSDLEDISGGIILINSSAKVQNNHFEKDSSAGVTLLGSSNAEINYNNFINNYDYAVENRTPNNVNAMYNYWNSPNGPRLSTTGEGERVSSGVIYDNFKTEKIKYTASFDKDTLYDKINAKNTFTYFVANWTSTPHSFKYSLKDKNGKIQNILDKQIEIDSLNFTEIVEYKSDTPGNNEIILEVSPLEDPNDVLKDTLYVISYIPTVKDIIIIPDTLFIKVNEMGLFSSIGVDQHQQYVDINPSWTATGGKIDSNGVYVAGDKPGIYQATATYDNVTKNAVIVIQDSVVSVADNFIKEDIKTEIYPNPSVDIFNIQLTTNNQSQAKINIYSTNGHLIERIFDGFISNGNNKFVWDARNYSNGTYLLVIDIGLRRYAYSLIIKR